MRSHTYTYRERNLPLYLHHDRGCDIEKETYYLSRINQN